jgi:hypothetical protein
MSKAEENKALVRRFMEARAKADLNAIEEMMAPDFISHGLHPGQQPGRECLKRTIAEIRTIQEAQAAVPESPTAIGRVGWVILVDGEAVPFLPVLRYKESGLRNRAVWEQTWELQRREDAIDARVEQELTPRTGETEAGFRKRVEDEYADLQERIGELRAILGDEKRIDGLVKSELLELRDTYAKIDDRRTEIVAAEGELELEDLIAEEDMVIAITRSGYIKRLPVTTYREQKRGGIGVMGMELKDEDYIAHLFVASTHDYILFFTSVGKVYRLKVHELPLGTRQAKGRAIANFLPFQQGETNFDATTNAVWYNNRFMEDDGDAIPIVAYGFLQDDGTFERDPMLPDVPTVDEAHEMIHGEPPSGEAWEAFQDVMAVIHVAHAMTMHPDAPPEALATIRAGLIEAIEEGDYIDEWLENQPSEPFYTEEDIQASEEAIRGVDEGFVDWIQDWLEENYPDEFG